MRFYLALGAQVALRACPSSTSMRAAGSSHPLGSKRALAHLCVRSAATRPCPNAISGRGIVHLASVTYTATGSASGLGRGGKVYVPEAGLELRTGVPGRAASGVNPEQLLAAGWSACFLSSLQLAAKRASGTGSARPLSVPADLAIEVDVHLGQPERTGQMFGLAADIYAVTQESDKAHVARLLRLAETICPYSQSLKDSIAVRLHPEGRPGPPKHDQPGNKQP